MPSRTAVVPLLLALPAALAALLFWRSSLDVFNTTKFTAIVLATVLVIGFTGAVALATGALHRPRGPWAWAAVGWLVASGTAVVVSPTPLRSVVGVAGRHGGFALYAALLLLATAAVTHLRARPDRAAAAAARGIVVDVLLVTAVPVVAYTLLQALGADPLVWTTVEGGEPVFSTFGNVDFASAWIGMVVVLALGVALDVRAASWRRRSAGVLAGA